MLRTVIASTLTALLLGAVQHSSSAATLDNRYRLDPGATPEAVPDQPYVRHTTMDRFGRRITFYVAGPQGSAPLPLVVYVQGSGCASLFRRSGTHVAAAAGQAAIAEAWQGKGNLLIVEKPGVPFLNAPSSCERETEFNREHSLGRWSEAVEASIRAARQLPIVRHDRLIVIGHSEGGVVAARIAHDLGPMVSHVALLSGEGPTQLYSLIRLARQGLFVRGVSEDADVRAKYVVDQWRAIAADPNNIVRSFAGHSYLRWASFLSTSPLEELAGVTARIYVAAGDKDTNQDPSASDVLYAQLLTRGKDVTYDRVSNADHSFRIPDSNRNGWREEHEKLVIWCFSPS